MANEINNEFGALRLKKDKVEFLKDIKDALECSIGNKLTFEEFFDNLIECFKTNKPAIWAIYEIKLKQKEELQKIIDASRNVTAATTTELSHEAEENI